MLTRPARSDGNGEIDMSEFVVASLRLSQLLRRDKTAWREKTKQAFDKLDTNGDGFICLLYTSPSPRDR